jgi:hypothetical protein
MAVLLWTVPRFEAPSEQVLDAPVRVQLNVPDFARFGDPEPPTIRVTLSGPTRELLAVDRVPVWVQIDSVVSLDTTVALLTSMVRLPPGVEGVEVAGLEPASVRIAFEEIVDGSSALIARMEGTLPDGLSLAGPVQVTPSVVRVSGPQSQVTQLDSLFLDPLDLSQVLQSGGFVQSVDRSGLEELGLVVSPSVATVQVSVEETRTAAFPDLLVEVPGTDSGPPIRSSPAAVSVTLIGAGSLVDAVDPASLRVKIPPGPAASLSPGQEIQVDPVVEGIPALLEALLDPSWVTLRRPTGSR